MYNNSKYIIVFLVIIWSVFLVWEWYVSKWAETVLEPIIRVDFIMIFPILILVSTYAVFQLINQKK